jgi:hypothetical protein
VTHGRTAATLVDGMGRRAKSRVLAMAVPAPAGASDVSANHASPRAVTQRFSGMSVTALLASMRLISRL